MEEKFARMNKGASNPFIDPDGYKRYVAEREKTFRAELEKQKAGAK
jgi:metallo-beta-lactamase class B